MKNADARLSNWVKREGRVLVADLSKQFKTSQVTIRKDLELLHEQGLLHRSHGGALPDASGPAL